MDCEVRGDILSRSECVYAEPSRRQYNYLVTQPLGAVSPSLALSHMIFMPWEPRGKGNRTEPGITGSGGLIQYIPGQKNQISQTWFSEISYKALCLILQRYYVFYVDDLDTTV